MATQTPEQKAHDNIDAMLKQAGWKVQPKKKIDFTAGPGIAVREYDSRRLQDGSEPVIPHAVIGSQQQETGGGQQLYRHRPARPSPGTDSRTSVWQ